MPGMSPRFVSAAIKQNEGLMHRREFITAIAAAVPIAAFTRRAAAVPQGWREFEITYKIALKDAQPPVRLWVPVPQDALDYHRVINLTWQAPVPVEVLWEQTSRAPIVAMHWVDGSTARQAEITARVATHARSGFFMEEAPTELAEYLRPSKSVPTDGVVLKRAREIVADRVAPLDKARAIYDWIVDNTFRRAETRGCGMGDVGFMLETGDFGGKCADINSLFVGLARAAGLPARDFFGVRVTESRVSPSLGKSDDVTKAQHCRAEVYIDGKGWFPVDPADVRKVVLEEGVPVDSDKVRNLRERLFGNWEMNWVGFNYGRDFTLPDQKQGPIGFLMYPYAETADGALDSLDPTGFGYAITARELA